jgi:hypothetical protein
MAGQGKQGGKKGAERDVVRLRRAGPGWAGKCSRHSRRRQAVCMEALSEVERCHCLSQGMPPRRL